MSYTITKKNVFEMAAHVEEMLKHMELLKDDETIKIQEGSNLYGRAWRAFKTVGDSGALHELRIYGVQADGFIGNTKKEAYEELDRIGYMNRK